MRCDRARLNISTANAEWLRQGRLDAVFSSLPSTVYLECSPKWQDAWDDRSDALWGLFAADPHRAALWLPALHAHCCFALYPLALSARSTRSLPAPFSTAVTVSVYGWSLLVLAGCVFISAGSAAGGALRH